MNKRSQLAARLNRIANQSSDTAVNIFELIATGKLKEADKRLTALGL